MDRLRQDFGGGAFFDLFAIPNVGGEPMNLTRTPEISEQGAHWSPDGKQLAFSYRPKAASTEDLALLDYQRDQRYLALDSFYPRKNFAGLTGIFLTITS
jgi:hypothetical protein